MNRSVALFVALALLVAHALAIHITASGDLAPPYDSAYAAFRVGRNLVHEGTLAWGQEIGGLESYPSFLWTLFAYAVERTYLPINYSVQLMGGACAIATIILTSRFHADRVASMVAPFLLAISGSFAAAALNGMETALLALLLTACFVASERGWSWTFGMTLALSGLASPEAWILTPLFLLQRYLPGLRQGATERPHAAAFLLPIAAFIALATLRAQLGGELVSSYTVGLLAFLEFSPAGVFSALRDFLISSVSPFLLIYTLWYLIRGRLSGTGSRALFLGTAWVLLAGTHQSDPSPFNQALVPALPLLLVAGQEGLIIALNSTRGWVRHLAWGTFFGTGLLSILASRAPEDLGSLRLSHYHYNWLTPSHENALGSRSWLGRPGLAEEIEKTQFLRATGIFFRDNVDPGQTVLSPWPGSIGYLSGLDVRDLRGRATALPGESRLRSWHHPGRADLLAALEARADYLIPNCRPRPIAPNPISLAKEWIDHLDSQEFDDKGRLASVLRALEPYELITVPLPSPSRRASNRFHAQAHVLRLRALGLTPELKLSREGDFVVVTCSHGGHDQLANLRLSLVEEDGEPWHVTPTGELATSRSVLARMELLLTRTGARPLQLMSVDVSGDEWRGRTLRATLVNPGAQGRHAFVRASATVQMDIGL